MPKRKNTRLPYYDYSHSGAYFITICTKNKKEILSEITVGTGVLDGPQVKLSRYGMIADKYIRQLNSFYTKVIVENYVIMPNHIHFIIRIPADEKDLEYSEPIIKVNNTNSVISKFISTFKRFCNKECRQNIWQYRSYDHVIRNANDYNEIWSYIENNPAKWTEDKLHPNNRSNS